MNILILGSGGREHSLAWAVMQNPKCDRLIVAPGNAGIAAIADCADLDINDGGAVVTFAEENAIDFVIIGPEAPLAAGVADRLRAAGILVFGPNQAAARLEASKAFTKEICDAVGAPTAAYRHFTDATSARAYVEEQGAPIVIKADGLAAGKGVIIAETLQEAFDAIDEMFSGAFGGAGAEVVIEEFMTGEEASFFVLCDGETVLPIGTAQDHKRVGEGDTGPNTGGMGAYSPAPVLTDAVTQAALEEIVKPTVAEMARRGTPYQGVLFVGPDDRGRRAAAGGIQRALRRSGMSGADDAARRAGARPDAGGGRRAAGAGAGELGRGPRAHRGHGRGRLSRHLPERLGHPRPRCPAGDQPRDGLSRRHSPGKRANQGRGWPCPGRDRAGG